VVPGEGDHALTWRPGLPVFLLYKCHPRHTPARIPHAPAQAHNVARRILESACWAGFTFNGITAYGDGHDSLIGGDALSDGERDALLELCRQRLDAFRKQRGEEVFAHRSRHRSPISGSVKYRVLTRARSRCECCGAHEHQRALEVAPIIPKNQGGSDAISNLQALCFRCNAGKRDGCLPTQEGAPTSAVCRPATATAKQAVCSARWRAAAGCCWRTSWRSASPMPIP
jgi:hypothetical protein